MTSLWETRVEVANFGSVGIVIYWFCYFGCDNFVADVLALPAGIPAGGVQRGRGSLAPGKAACRSAAAYDGAARQSGGDLMRR